MREIFEDIFANQPLDPMESARRSMRSAQRKRFYEVASVGEPTDAGFPVLLDGKPVRTPARKFLAAPSRALALKIAAEWQNSGEVIDPFKMPLTRLANTIVDGIAGAEPQVADEIRKYLGSDLVFYRATQPEGLAARQREHWNPLLAFASNVLRADFVLAADVTFVGQPDAAVAAAAQAIPRDPWRLGAVHLLATLTGSALLALALAAGEISPEAAWSAAHVDEDWNMDFWGRDALAVERRANRFSDFQAALDVLGTTAVNKP
jgi:chaperone required for assembly of F1-ATPase